MKNIYIYTKYKNLVVLQGYLSVIKLSFEHIGCIVEYVESLDHISKNEWIVFPMGIDAFKYYCKGYRNFVLWQQGATADESFMRHKSHLRYHLLNYFDCFSMKKAKLIFFVSERMKRHYEALSKKDFSNKSYVMPCYNERLDPTVFAKKSYEKNIFTYVGSLAPWQCFERTVEIYAALEQVLHDASLKVLTFDTFSAERILKAKGVKNYSVKCVPKEQVNAELIEASYGFIIREENMVNQVATPTKFSSYLAAGVLPIYSACLGDFKTVAQGKSFACALEDNADFSHMLQFIRAKKAPETLQNEITSLFDTYYNADYHATKIAALISSQNFFKEC